jgi:hypothetical protein
VNPLWLNWLNYFPMSQLNKGNTQRKRGGKSGLQLPESFDFGSVKLFITKLPTDNQSVLVLIPLSYCSPARCMHDMRHRDGGMMQGSRHNTSRYPSTRTRDIWPVSQLLHIGHGDEAARPAPLPTSQYMGFHNSHFSACTN